MQHGEKLYWVDLVLCSSLPFSWLFSLCNMAKCCISSASLCRVVKSRLVCDITSCRVVKSCIASASLCRVVKSFTASASLCRVVKSCTASVSLCKVVKSCTASASLCRVVRSCIARVWHHFSLQTGEKLYRERLSLQSGEKLYCVCHQFSLQSSEKLFLTSRLFSAWWKAELRLTSLLFATWWTAALRCTCPDPSLPLYHGTPVYCKALISISYSLPSTISSRIHNLEWTGRYPGALRHVLVCRQGCHQRKTLWQFTRSSIWNWTRPRALMKNQNIRQTIGARNTQHKYNKDLKRLR